MTTLINLIDVMYILSNSIFLDLRDPLGMTVALINVVLFAGVIIFGYQRTFAAEDGEAAPPPALERWLRAKFATVAVGPAAQPPAPPVVLDWLRIDTIMVAAFTIVAAALHFWHLGHPPEIVFDEVHFVGQARHYLHGETFLDPHPPLAKLLIALGILIGGDHPWAWRRDGRHAYDSGNVHAGPPDVSDADGSRARGDLPDDRWLFSGRFAHRGH